MKLLLPLCLLITSASAADLQFENLWQKIEINSNVLKASDETIKAEEINKSRSEKHWYPTIYANANSYLTNDPGANMFGLLSQREITQPDFMPDKLNHPGTNLFNKGSLGVNISLYEGGMKEAILKASTFQLDAKKNNSKAISIEFYSEVAKDYFSLFSLNHQKEELDKVEKTINSIISKYQIGNKENLLGYSGLLGLKSLKNRLVAITDENHAKVIAFTKAISELSKTNESIDFKASSNFVDNLKIYLPTEQNEYQVTDKIKVLDNNAKAAAEVVGAEKSRNLPRVGAFAESYAFNGDRKTTGGFSTGLYLNWNLFSGNDIGADQQAIHNSHAARYFAEASAQKEKMEFDGLTQSEETLLKTISTLEESQKLLDEQTAIATTLFKNGMINALQLVEVLSRRVDLLNTKNEVEINLINTKAKKMVLTNLKPNIFK